MKIELRVDIRFSPQIAFHALTGALLLLCAPWLSSENLTLSTYYPSPLGVYKQVVTTGNGGLDTVLARDAGKVGIGSASPAYKLDVVGTAHVTQNVTMDAALSVGSDLTAAGNAVFGPSGARSAWFQTDGQAYIGARLGIGYGPSSSYSLYASGDLRTDGYITNLCQSVSYGSSGWTSCPGSMTLVMMDSWYGDAAYHTGQGAGEKWSSFDAAGTMLCCRFW